MCMGENLSKSRICNPLMYPFNDLCGAIIVEIVPEVLLRFHQ